MRLIVKLTVLIMLSISVITLSACSPRQKGKDQSFSNQVKGLDKKDGLFGIYVDNRSGRILARLPKPDDNGVLLRVIHANSINAGLGSNPVGLDRGLTTSGQIIAFKKIGANIVVEAENSRYRASADNPQEKQSVRNSFAKSYLWAGPVKARAGNGDLLVDLSEFLTLDLMNIRGQLKGRGQGNYAIAAKRSFPETDSALAFPDNIELNAALTFTSDVAGNEVTNTAADGRNFTLSLHHSFVRLPDDDYTPRSFDPRVAAIDVGYYDFSTQIDEPITKTLARRFRLERTDPNVAKSPVKKPIIFYVDRGAPEPIRSALIDGASWWAQAFEEAGFEDAYRVEILPEDAHPLDIRYNVIQWTHRQTRGWSYGGGIFDPRTGEMLKAHVILGSQRVRQDRMIFEGLTGTRLSGSGQTNDPVAISLARIRQLAAHEVGHTIGFAHNFAASTNNRASVMDYPAPYIRPTENGELDFSEAYDTGIGEWDKFTVKWLYSQFTPDADENKILNNMVTEIYEDGHRFVSDAHARSVSAAHPLGSLWDNGTNPIATLDETMIVRSIALRNFDLDSIREGEPRARLREVFVPVYLYHRYQVAAAAKLVGGIDYNYSVSGDTLPFSTPVNADTQRRAIASLLETLAPATLDIDDRILVRLSPAVGRFNGGAGGEVFASHLREIFDPLYAADAAATITLNALLDPNRMARLIESHRRNSNMPAAEELLAALEITIFAEQSNPRLAAIARRIQSRFISILINNARMNSVSPAVDAELDAYLSTLQSRLSSNLANDNQDMDSNHRAMQLSRISRHLNREDTPINTSNDRLTIPPGSPIGSDNGSKNNGNLLETCWHCDTDL